MKKVWILVDREGWVSMGTSKNRMSIVGSGQHTPSGFVYDSLKPEVVESINIAIKKKPNAKQWLIRN